MNLLLQIKRQTERAIQWLKPRLAGGGSPYPLDFELFITFEEKYERGKKVKTDSSIRINDEELKRNRKKIATVLISQEYLQFRFAKGLSEISG